VCAFVQGLQKFVFKYFVWIWIETNWILDNYILKNAPKYALIITLNLKRIILIW